MKKILLLSTILVFIFNSFALAEKEKNVSGTLLINVKAWKEYNMHDLYRPPIKGARILIIDSLGKIVGNVLTDNEGKAVSNFSVPRDPRFPNKDLGVVTVIAIADGYNEFINFNVVLNEHGTEFENSVNIFLRGIVWGRRNEPQYIHASFHRHTVFPMLDYYAKKAGLVRQDIPLKYQSLEIAPWSPQLK
ncbi:hypothetical protein CIB95_09385 [Lottiidibacillus patelloidae]|uniref:Uncharacterized protein n=1 Tax=Lottiidibacillus patelloidae TaxID=2670334 RepID=A0A263BTC4_9BACI|nr:hypothetical protein [Lottiidibacillus patelloidae]OZM56973.1 hypothetical protein CIB95_09385 [Lottiidibacillus patelloidae]